MNKPHHTSEIVKEKKGHCCSDEIWQYGCASAKAVWIKKSMRNGRSTVVADINMSNKVGMINILYLTIQLFGSNDLSCSTV